MKCASQEPPSLIDGMWEILMRIGNFELSAGIESTSIKSNQIDSTLCYQIWNTGI